MNKIRTRFAPSPTGALHPGVLRTALFAWLLAKHADGQFLLRLEDTDQKREVSGAIENIKDSLKWLGLEWDEGPDIGGPAGSYVQSERLEIYKQWGQKLLDKGRAYADPFTAKELQTLREKAKDEKQPFLYRNHRPENPPAWDGSQPLRLKSTPKTYQWHDEVMGDLEMGAEMIDDFILIKSDGFPTYNFAHIVDDYEMNITHVMRSQEFLSSIPKYLDLYHALEIPVPIMAIVPPVLREDGKKKLSKRDGAKELLWYRDQGYMSEALVNFMATLGWNDGTEQELFSRDELIEKFSLNHVHRSGAKFDEERLLWMNGQWIRRLGLEDLYKRTSSEKATTSFWPPEAATASDEQKKRILSLVQDRLKTLADLPTLTRYFFSEPKIDLSLIESNKQLAKLEKAELQQLIKSTIVALEKSDFSVETLTKDLNQLLGLTGQKPGILFSLIRIVTTWAPFSPELASTLHVLGKETTLNRLKIFLEA